MVKGDWGWRRPVSAQLGDAFLPIQSLRVLHEPGSLQLLALIGWHICFAVDVAVEVCCRAPRCGLVALSEAPMVIYRARRLRSWSAAVSPVWKARHRYLQLASNFWSLLAATSLQLCFAKAYPHFRAKGDSAHHTGAVVRPQGLYRWLAASACAVAYGVPLQLLLPP